jgi:receptor expression-enhancing protein 1/2/3/4
MSALIYQCTKLVVGMLYPAYSSFKAVHTKNVKDYVKWMMYWIVFASYLFVEAVMDLCCSWIPFYTELKMLFVLWMIAPVTRGSTVLYRKVVHPQLVKREKDIDSYLDQVKDHGYQALIRLGTRGVSIATNVVITTAVKGSDHLKRSLSLSDLSSPDYGRDLVRYNRYGRALSLDTDALDSNASDDDDERYTRDLAGSPPMRKDLADSQKLEELDRELCGLPLLSRTGGIEESRLTESLIGSVKISRKYRRQQLHRDLLLNQEAPAPSASRELPAGPSVTTKSATSGSPKTTRSSSTIQQGIASKLSKFGSPKPSDKQDSQSQSSIRPNSPSLSSSSPSSSSSRSAATLSSMTIYRRDDLATK